LRLYPGGDIGPVVDEVISVQQTLDVENLSDFVEQLKPICRLIVVETGDKLLEIK
jgi:hypothetical protein